MPEFAAQLETALRQTVSRLLVICDATSPVTALFAFALQHERRRGDAYYNHWLSEWLQRLVRFDLVVFFHIKSHEGSVLNEVADVLAKAALFLKPERVHVGARTHVSIAFHGAGRAITGTQRVHREARRLVLLD